MWVDVATFHFTLQDNKIHTSPNFLPRLYYSWTFFQTTHKKNISVSFAFITVNIQYHTMFQWKWRILDIQPEKTLALARLAQGVASRVALRLWLSRPWLDLILWWWTFNSGSFEQKLISFAATLHQGNWPATVLKFHLFPFLRWFPPIDSL